MMLNSGVVISCTWSVERFIGLSKFTLVPQTRCQLYLTSHLNQVVRVTPIWTRQSKTISMVLTLFSWTLSTHQHWRYALMRLMPCLLLSSEFLCLVSTHSNHSRLDWSLLLASNILHYGARLGHCYNCTTGRLNASL